MISVNQLFKHFEQGNQKIEVLKGVDLSIKEGEFIAIMGPSGSGKSTLLQLLGGLDTPSSGQVKIQGKDFSGLTEKQRTIVRRKDIGFIFQNYQLLPTLTVEENIGFPLHADGRKDKNNKEKIINIIKEVGLEGLEKKSPNLLSGGQQQRVSIARGLIHEPKILLADEPTGNLDRKRAEEILDLLSKFNKQRKQSIIMVTHDIFAAGYADKIILFKDGLIEKEVTREDHGYAEYLASFLA
ncbi:putative ABC transport system ATP-binding protein [Cytobacillus horneckiae]|uniref:ABC transporter ATP-binding protein n=1 Tax=Cytobacillus horneckiae TaxID=549687 RepID=A0A2N0ZBX0_9BACI|nr:ABC transporter ATP-binding protein [Cytobacillus horneckiae]MBN6886051.1 ABC transporter ATP-binding protein [Cytobacillus horneckiae]MCM3176356.1 ABC transporter ATP-binding protein [Cytobacillus horneckiae]MEC1159166.1 ABC transporter ATP-binding protein [Cytobacillus horneckiae]MED2940864.1 ABC transporter ATP-binding protein [Cytobacillus horneckiae]PKG27031.1 ABC transporter ATP-binding protein [Cytobacillus horneckiae]